MGLVPRRVNKVGVIGGGQMASEIATALILGNYQVILKEENDKLLQDGIGRVRGTVRLESYIKIIIARFYSNRDRIQIGSCLIFFLFIQPICKAV
jgi:3-hydroxyacyl-CoA dehydrogenase